MAYTGTSGSELRYATKFSCGSWAITPIDSNGGEDGFDLDLTLVDDYIPHIGYTNSLGILRYATYALDDNFDLNWRTEIVSSYGNPGRLGIGGDSLPLKRTLGRTQTLF